MAEWQVTISKPEYRPCYVSGIKALFHKWEDKSEIVPPSVLKGGHNGGVISKTFGIVEFENGEVAEVEPRRIIFADNTFREYAFYERVGKQ